MATKKRVFDDSCAIVPEAVAVSVLEEAEALFADVIGEVSREFANGAVSALATMAEEIASSNEDFRKSIVGARGSVGRDRLYVFMRHWLASRLARHWPSIRSHASFGAFSNGEVATRAAR